MKKSSKKVTLSSISKSIERLVTKDDLEKSIEKLAVITAHGFETTVTKTEFAEFKNGMTDFAQKTAMTLFNMDSKLQTIDQRLDAIEKTLGPLVHASSFYQSALREHERRIALLERKAGFSKS